MVATSNRDARSSVSEPQAEAVRRLREAEIRFLRSYMGWTPGREGAEAALDRAFTDAARTHTPRAGVPPHAPGRRLDEE